MPNWGIRRGIGGDNFIPDRVGRADTRNAGAVPVVDTTHEAGASIALPGAQGSALVSNGPGSKPSFQIVSGTGPSYNVIPQNFQHLRKAIAQVRRGVAPAGPVLCGGDSITNGNSASWATNYPTLLTALLNLFVPTAQTWSVGHNPGDVLDPRITLGSNWTLTNVVNQYAFRNSSTSGTMSYAPCGGSVNGPTAVDTVDIYNLQFGAYTGSFTVDIGGSTLATIANTGSPANPNGVNKTTVALGAHGAETINITPVGGNGNTWIKQLRAYDSTNPVLETCNYGIGGITALGWDAAVAVDLSFLTPVLTILDLGTNDASAPTTPVSYQATMQSIISLALAVGDTLLTSFIPSGSTGLVQTEEAAYLPLLLALSASNNVPYLDKFARWVSYNSSNTLGLMANVTHPNALGYADIASSVAEVLRTVI